MPKQINREVVLETWLNNPNLSYAEIARKAGIAERTFDYLRHDAPFMEEYHKRCQARFAEAEAIAVAKMVELAADGNFNAIKYILDNKGYKPVDKIEQVSQTTIKVALDEE